MTVIVLTFHTLNGKLINKSRYSTVNANIRIISSQKYILMTVSKYKLLSNSQTSVANETARILIQALWPIVNVIETVF